MHELLYLTQKLNTYLYFKIHILQKFLVHCFCKFVDGSQEYSGKKKRKKKRYWLMHVFFGILFQPCVVLKTYFNTGQARRIQVYTYMNKLLCIMSCYLCITNFKHNCQCPDLHWKFTQCKFLFFSSSAQYIMFLKKHTVFLNTISPSVWQSGSFISMLLPPPHGFDSWKFLHLLVRSWHFIFPIKRKLFSFLTGGWGWRRHLWHLKWVIKMHSKLN